VHPFPARRLRALRRGAPLFAKKPIRRVKFENGVAPLHPLR
jgi:hypothetical protein